MEHLLKKMTKKYEDSLRELQDNMKCNHIQIKGIPEGREKEQGIETEFEKIMTEIYPNLEKGKTTQVQEVQRIPVQMNPGGLLQDTS